jgi:hypothetical protein
MTKIYYGPDGDTGKDYMLVPAPTLSIDKEFAYANDVIIGYTYIVNLQGYITNYRKTNDTDDPNSSRDYVSKNIQKVLGGIELVRKILSRNGSNLAVYDDTSRVINCKGGTLRSINFEETDNNWASYATYTASIEFNEIEFLEESITCSSSDIDAASKSPLLVDIDSHKIKSFNDGWTFSVTEQSFDYVRSTNDGKDLKIHNMVINASYTINVTGKNYYLNELLIPAHEQARIFAQKRLYDRVSQLVSGGSSNLFKVTTDVNSEPCGSDTLNTIHQSGPGILGNISYLPHNETVSCEISESDGIFSANYACTLKSKATGMTYSDQSVIHTVSRSRTREAQSGSRDNYTLSIDGTIQGLVLGGLIYSAGNFSLPNNGSFMISANSSTNKYSTASSFYSSIGSDSDLIDAFKDVLNITFDELEADTSECSNLPPYPKPSSFNLTRNYIDGTINYSAEYSTDSSCNRDGESIQNISITTDNPTPVLAEFIIPNGPVVIQDIKTVTAKKITINIDGRKNTTRNCCNDLTTIISDLGCSPIVLPSGVSLPDPTKYILTQKTRTDNKIEGTYNITLGYICESGCSI